MNTDIENINEDLKKEFLEFLFDAGILKFGDFTLKSGRKSPYFFNMGEVDSGITLVNLGIFYARAIHDNFGVVDNIFGPAYKGITLAAASAIGFALEYEEEVNFCFDRKEEKTHGDKGKIVGAPPQPGDRIVIVDDVMTTGGTKYEAVELLRSFEGTEVAGLVIGMNRKEKTEDGSDAMARFKLDTGVEAYAMADVYDVLDFLKEKNFDKSLIEKMEEYIAAYGV
jgi:orotate phosphoribosyltransferase